VAWSIEILKEHLLIGSTLVEGSTLSEEEARDVLAGRTVLGHPVRELRELSNYQAATEWLIERFKAQAQLSTDVLLGYHAQLMQGLSDDAGRFKSFANYTVRSDGERHSYQHPAQVAADIAEWLVDFNAPAADVVTSGAELYARFQRIHPFSDGNGRIGRVLLAYYAHRETSATFAFYAKDKLEHLRAIEATDTGDLTRLCDFVRARLRR
jgi:Fic family protein